MLVAPGAVTYIPAHRNRSCTMPRVVIGGRSVFTITGPEAEHFLQNVVTTDLDRLVTGDAVPGALLTPQGKIIADFLIARIDGGFLIDTDQSVAEELRRRLAMYKMRAKAEIGVENQGAVIVTWGSDSTPSGSDSSYRDTRFGPQSDVWRTYFHDAGATGGEDSWLELRIAHGVSECGADYETCSVFPHDVLMDHNGGVSFQKGCFIGQEVVSRMQHRGTARRRIMIASSQSALPSPGTEITSGGKSIGVLASTQGNNSLALVRVDRASEAVEAGTPLTADSAEISLRFPDHVRIRFPLSGEPETAS